MMLKVWWPHHFSHTSDIQLLRCDIESNSLNMKSEPTLKRMKKENDFNELVLRISLNFSLSNMGSSDLWVYYRNKSRITLSIKQLEEDPLLETLEKVIPQVWCVVFISSFFFIFQNNNVPILNQSTLTSDPIAVVIRLYLLVNWSILDMQDDSSSSSSDGTTDYVIEPLSGLETILEELLREDG